MALHVFDCERDWRGARAIFVHTPIMSLCTTDAEIHVKIKLLKDNLDAVALKMKKAIRERADKLVF
jgi:hypothetical protein